MKKTLNLAFGLFRRLANVFPKKRNLVLFGARKGNWYTDCSRHVYEKILSQRPDIQPVWMTLNHQVYEDLKGRGFPVCRLGSMRGYYLLMRAPLAAISTQLYDIAEATSAIPDSLRIIFLGHGKSVKASTLAFGSGRSKGFRTLFQRTAELTDVAISTSPFITDLAATSTGFPENLFVATGYPRNDTLLKPEPDIVNQWSSYVGDIDPEMIVLYAPTWRQRGEPTRFFPFEDFDPGALNRFLAERRILLLVRPHERDLLHNQELRLFLDDLSRTSDWVRICDEEVFGSANHVLPFIDVLVSDYSSIYNDFLLTDQPMVFIPYDHDEFARTQGFMYDYYETLPGPPVYSLREFTTALKDILEGKDRFKDKRKELRRLIHTHVDSEATRRVIEIIDKELGTAATIPEVKSHGLDQSTGGLGDGP